MLRGPLIHPGILEALGRCGHGDRILIADGNYPHVTTLGPRAAFVALNLAPGVVSCTQVFDALLGMVPIEGLHVMDYERAAPGALRADPSVWAEYEASVGRMGMNVPLERLDRSTFYAAAGAGNVALTIATGDQRLYANVLITIGAILPPEGDGGVPSQAPALRVPGAP